MTTTSKGFMKKSAALFIALILMFSMVLTASATSYPMTATVKFYNSSTQLWTTQTVTFTANPTKSYLPSGYTDPLSGAASVYDAIIAAAASASQTTTVGWDSYSTPNGGYITAVGSYVSYNNYTYDESTGTNISDGAGWSGYVTPAGGTQYSPDTYLTNVALTDGMTITFVYDTYHYEW